MDHSHGLSPWRNNVYVHNNMYMDCAYIEFIFPTPRGSQYLGQAIPVPTVVLAASWYQCEH